LDRFGHKFFRGAHTIGRAVEMIDREMSDGDISLLSPASASFDQFKSYKG